MVKLPNGDLQLFRFITKKSIPQLRPCIPPQTCNDSLTPSFNYLYYTPTVNDSSLAT